MAAECAHDFVQEPLERLDSCHDGDFSRILLRMESLNRIIINCGELADSIVLDPPQHVYLANKDQVLYTRQTVQNVPEDQFVFLVDSEFTRPKLSELLEIKKEKKRKEGSVGVCVWGELFLVSLHAQISVDCFRKSTFRSSVVWLLLNAPQKQNLIYAIILGNEIS